MSTVRITSGDCGYVTVVTVRSRGKREPLSVEITSDCEAVDKMAEEIKELGAMAAFTGFLSNPVYRAAARHLKHVSCPVPSGILKALEVEAGFALPTDAHIAFVDGSERRRKGD